MAKKLNPRMLLFIKNYLQSGNGTASAKAAGYSENDAAKRSRILLEHPLVAVEVAKHRKQLEKKIGHGLEQAMKQGQEAYEVAKATNNGMAMTKAAEFMAKLNGLLIERHQVQQVPFTVEILRNELPVIELESKPTNKNDDSKGDD